MSIEDNWYGGYNEREINKLPKSLHGIDLDEL